MDAKLASITCFSFKKTGRTLWFVKRTAARRGAGRGKLASQARHHPGSDQRGPPLVTRLVFPQLSSALTRAPPPRTPGCQPGNVCEALGMKCCCLDSKGDLTCHASSDCCCKDRACGWDAVSEQQIVEQSSA